MKGYPKLVYIRNKEPLVYTGDLLDEEKLLGWLTSEEQMDIPDRIDDVNRKALMKLVNESDYVACFFCKRHRPDFKFTITLDIKFSSLLYP